MTVVDQRSASEERTAWAPGNRYAIGVLTKALDLIDLLDANEALTLTELSARSGISKSTALRLLANLRERGYVEREAPTGHYRLGFRLLQLGMRKSAALDLRTLARPILQRLRLETDETVNLAVPTPDGIVYIDILESSHGLRMTSAVGTRDDFHSTALGKAILAHAAPGAFPTPSGPLPPKTPHTIVDRDALARELTVIRLQGYAFDDEENEAGARCLSAPIFDHNGQVVAAVSVSGPASRFTTERQGELVRRIKAAGAGISGLLGFPGMGDDGLGG